MEVSKVVQYLRNFAPIRLAESWDNVGLLVEPVSKKRLVSKILLTIDLTEKVLDEAIRLDAPFIVAYHPPIFTAMKKLTSQTVKERIAVKAIENGIAIYSPHTTYDSLHGGVNDWLACAVTTSIPSSSSSSSSSTAAVLTQQGEHTVTVLQPHSFYNDGTFDTANPNNTNTPGFASLRATVFSPSANSTASDSKSPALNSLEKLQQSIGAIIGKSLTSTFSSS